MPEARNRLIKKSDFIIFLLSAFFLSHWLLPSLATKASLSHELLTEQHHFHHSTPLQSFFLHTGKSGSSGLLQFCEVLTRRHFKATEGPRFSPGHCACAVHMQTLVAFLLVDACVWGDSFSFSYNNMYPRKHNGMSISTCHRWYQYK